MSKRPKQKVINKVIEEVPIITMNIDLIFKPDNKVIFRQRVRVPNNITKKELINRFLDQFNIHYEEDSPKNKLIIVGK